MVNYNFNYANINLLLILIIINKIKALWIFFLPLK